MDRLICPAPAKLNLFLQVIGRRPDGYHELQTLFRFLDLADILTFTLRSDGLLRRARDVEGVPLEQDLTLRAARLLQRSARTHWGADIALDKRLPIGGGLGGGSSDAATTLIALNRLWGLDWARDRLQEIALELGADVPVFVFGRSAFAEGVGERLQPVVLPPAWYVVLIPPAAVSTARVFADPELTRNSDPIKIRGFSAGPGRNDLEAVTCRLFPQVARHLEWLRRFGAAAMTGSGGCVFAAFESEAQAQDVLGQLPSDMAGFSARGVDRHPLLDWLR
ncbi:MAG TPA: 4-(cytidine 5'-diphospho)-2-C-methyl-D-erythritol kinase [Burkholderiales bacterium]|nr:4-(cytidine 5'-diphospho)-2-C-methyl-D-erythritol kinase [Burkholderiales bacterium]